MRKFKLLSEIDFMNCEEAIQYLKTTINYVLENFQEKVLLNLAENVKFRIEEHDTYYLPFKKIMYLRHLKGEDYNLYISINCLLDALFDYENGELQLYYSY